MYTHACTVHKFVHAYYPAINNIPRIGDFEKTAKTPLKGSKRLGSDNQVIFLGGFGGVCFLHFFDLVKYFFSENGFSSFFEFPKLLTFSF